MIPNILHFICITPMKFELIHFISVYSAYIHNKPENIYIYVDDEPVDNFFWDCLKEFVTVEKVKNCREFNGHQIEYTHQISDLIRMEKLIEKGGIYMDLDVVSLKPLTNLLDNDIVLIGEKNELDGKYFHLTNSIILAEPDNDFIKLWFDHMAPYTDIKKYGLAYHSIVLPTNMLNKYSKLFNSVKVLDYKQHFAPFQWNQYEPFVFKNDKSVLSSLDNYYTIIFYQTIVYDIYLKNINLDFLLKESLFSSLFNYIVDFLATRLNLLFGIVKRCYIWQDYPKLEKLSKEYLLLEQGTMCAQETKFYLAYAYARNGSHELSKKEYIELLNDSDLNPEIRDWSTYNLSLLA